MTLKTARKGASRTADITPEVLAALSRGEMQSATLTECLAVDQALLARMVFPELAAQALDEIDAACTLGILKRMGRIGAILYASLGCEGIAYCQSHPADMVRGWACFMIGTKHDMGLSARLDAIAPLADDSHFGVREWAWMAVRPHLVAELATAIALLTLWTSNSSPYLRRFASEVLRPRGVWCAHITQLKQDPGKGLPLLQPLCADPSVYVQDSVANWLNDVAKDQPAWVRAVCAQWQGNNPASATQRICMRALRNLS
jgi:3-methyladenine DNA glycosylase AlkC